MASKPIAPTTVKTAASLLTSCGTLQARFFGTATYSACGPLLITLSPILKSFTPSPTAVTTPRLQYPKGIGSSNFLNTASKVGINPSLEILFNTCSTRSGF